MARQLEGRMARQLEGRMARQLAEKVGKCSGMEEVKY